MDQPLVRPRIPASVFRKIGKTETLAIRKIGTVSPIPNIMIASGIHAILLIGRSNPTNGSVRSANHWVAAAAKANASPMVTPIAMPMPRWRRLAAMSARSSSPRIWARTRITSDGGGRSTGLSMVAAASDHRP